MPKARIYLDNHATTPVDERVLEAMLPYLKENFGNASSGSHAFGWEAEAAVNKARQQVAELIGAEPSEIIFTSGATESNNLALKGAVDYYKAKGNHIVTLQTEHKAVLETCKWLERVRVERMEELKALRLMQLLGRAVHEDEIPSLSQTHALQEDLLLQLWASTVQSGARVSYLPVQQDGRVCLKSFEKALQPSTVVASVGLANSEIGTLQPIDEIGALCRKHGVLFHVDAVQGAGKVPFHVEEASADLVSLSSHKLYGPKGIGALYVRKKPRIRLSPLLHGGGQERGMRSGTLNVPSIVGFGKACEIAKAEQATEATRLKALRERLWKGISSQLDFVSVNASMEHRLPGNLSIAFSFVEGDALMRELKSIAVSTGSACASDSLQPSYVLSALGLGDEVAHCSLRFGLGRFTTEAEIDETIARVTKAVLRLREISVLYEMAKQGVDLKGFQWSQH
ncbi:MAG: IscS subfamily cysteine desulfurase [Cystobacterineae bacterium]|nr:IscS subfamily cysteine desulfurase [Cystobacterineae bacterium]